VFLGGALDPERHLLDDDQLVALACEELAAIVGASSPPKLIEIARWPAAMPQYHLGHLERIERITQRLDMLPGLALAGAAYEGVGIPQVIASGQAAAKRVLASVLTWMAEKTSAVFVVATANAVERLPAELLRKGRFDEIFLLELPDAEERRTILDLQLRRRRPQHSLPLEVLVDRTAGFSGAELEQTVIEAMHLAFGDNRDLQEPDLIAAASQVVPLSRTAREQLEALRQWASSGRARPASDPRVSG
jgi:SpoVK/Ycf46/Vps4 family AAA+-type ATPase